MGIPTLTSEIMTVCQKDIIVYDKEKQYDLLVDATACLYKFIIKEYVEGDGYDNYKTIYKKFINDISHRVCRILEKDREDLDMSKIQMVLFFDDSLTRPKNKIVRRYNKRKREIKQLIRKIRDDMTECKVAMRQDYLRTEYFNCVKGIGHGEADLQISTHFENDNNTRGSVVTIIVSTDSDFFLFDYKTTDIFFNIYSDDCYLISRKKIVECFMEPEMMFLFSLFKGNDYGKKLLVGNCSLVKMFIHDKISSDDFKKTVNLFKLVEKYIKILMTSEYSNTEISNENDANELYQTVCEIKKNVHLQQVLCMDGKEENLYDYIEYVYQVFMYYMKFETMTKENYYSGKVCVGHGLLIAMIIIIVSKMSNQCEGKAFCKGKAFCRFISNIFMSNHFTLFSV